MARKRRQVLITGTEVCKVSTTAYLDHTRPRPVRVITWDDRNGEQHSVYLYSDNYPGLPTARLNSFANTSLARMVTKLLSPSIYWYNQFPHLTALVKSTSAALQSFACLSKNCYSDIHHRAAYCSTFFDWITKNDIQHIESLADIDLEILLRYRSYLYNDHRKDRLAKGLSNQKFWTMSIPGLIKFFLERPSFQLTHAGLSLATLPKFYTRESGVRSSVTPYSDIEMFEIITAADRTCSRYMHNWNVMREIEQLRVGDWKNIEDVCWFIVNIERQSSNDWLGRRGRTYVCLQQHHGLSYSQFYNKYSESEIQNLASRGDCPTETFQMSTFESLSDTGKCAYARAWVRRSISYLFDARKAHMAETLQSDHNLVFTSFRKPLNIFRTSMIRGQRSLFWEAAGFHPLPEVCPSEIGALFFPSVGAIYAFHLFVLATSGVNLHVLNSLDRNTLLSDLDPNNVVYLGKKNRTGRYNYRHEEIVVPRDEKDGVHERLQFVKEITSPFVRYLPNAGLWLGLRMRHSPNSRLVQLKRSEYTLANEQFCSQFGLQEVCYGENGELIDSTPMTFINSKRLRKSNVYKDMANEVPYHLIQAALADNSFNTVFKYYIDTAVQRQLNFKAIAALQCILMEEMKEYSRASSFAGEVIYDTPLSAARDISDNLLSACADTGCAFSGTTSADNRCKARFDVCLGCRNSRVFKEHLPAICFRIMQYDNKKLSLSIQDWDAAYGLFRARAIDCLERYARHGVDYAHHIDAAWIISKSDGGVYLPPLI